MAPDSPKRNTLRGAPFWVHAFALGTFGIVTLALLILYYIYRDTDVWYLWAAQPLQLQHAFNEAVQPSIFRQPANTLSNLGFIFVGLYMVAYAAWDARRDTQSTDPYAVRHPALMAFFGIACIVLGIGSGLMHGAMTSWGHKADVYGMYITMTALIALQWGRRFRALGPIPLWPFFIVLVIPLSAYLTFNAGQLGGGNAVMAGLIGLSGAGITADVLLRNPNQQWRWSTTAFLALALAYWIWNLDKADRFTPADSWIQGHAIWHLLNAVSLGCMAQFYRTELPLPRTADVHAAACVFSVESS